MEYFEQIKEIYREIFQEEDIDYAVRDLNLCDMIYFISQSCERISKLENASIHKQIEAILRVGALIMMFQPFTDGNKHTASTFISNHLEEFGYSLSSEEILKNRLIPIFYHPWEKIPKQKVLSVKRRIQQIAPMQ